MKIKACLLVVISSLLASSGYCESGYTIKMRGSGAGELSIRSSSTSGWVLTSGFVNGTRSTTLHGPGGYSRDLSKIEQDLSPATNSGLNGIYAFSVDGSGTVYFNQNVFQPDQGGAYTTFAGDKLYRLPLGAASLTQPLQQSQAQQLITEIKINDAGQFVYRTADSTNSLSAVTVQRFAGRPLTPVSVAFPTATAPRKSARITLEIDQAGSFVVYREHLGYARQGERSDGARRARVTVYSGLCTGSVSSDAVRCMSQAQLRRISAGNYAVKKIVNGSLLLEKIGAGNNTFKRVDLASFEVAETFRLKYAGKAAEKLFTSDGATAAVAGSLNFSPVLRLHRRGSDGVERTFRCVVATPVRPSPLLGQLREGPNGSFSAVLDTDPMTSAAGLFDLTPTEVPASATATPGLCLEVRR